jgi:hypothetical protein
VRSLLLVTLLVCACGSKELPPPNLPPFPEEPAEAQRPPPGTLWREDVDHALETGLGAFLQHVAVRPYFESDRFVGWEVVDLFPPELWSDVDLRPGDVVTGVNGMPIERDYEAFAAFESLAKAQELRVGVLRQGRGHELVFRIEPLPGTAGAKAPAPREAAAAKPNAKPAKSETSGKPAPAGDSSKKQ